MVAQKQQLLIDGPAGKLQLRFQSVNNQQQAASDHRLVVISHPHPLFGGTMNNKVVTTLERAFKSIGYETITYNFRGVDESEGQYDEGLGETDDLMAVLSWAQQQKNYQQIVLAGFSFGSYVALRASQQLDLDALCTVAPPVGLYDFSDFKDIKTPWLLIQGGADEVIDANEVMGWANKQSVMPDIYWRSQASHFFHGELVWLRKVVVAHYS